MGCLSSVQEIETCTEIRVANIQTHPIEKSPKASEHRFDTVDYLLRVPILSRLSDKDRVTLSNSLTEQVFNKGDVIVNEGEAARKFFIIKQGNCIATVLNKKEDNENATLTKGDYFGENSLFKMDKTPATITATSRVVVMGIQSNTFTKLFGENMFKVKLGKRKGVTAGKVPIRGSQTQEKPADACTEKDESTIALITSAVKGNILFTQFEHSPAQISQIVKEMWRLDVKAGKTLIKQGDPGDNFYVVESGTFDIFVSNKNNYQDLGTLVATCGTGKAFGELALLYNSPRAATVKATVDSLVWAIGRATFRRLLVQMSYGKLAEYEGFLASVPIFKSISTSERRAVAEALDTVVYNHGKVIIQQGDTDGDTFYIVRSGRAVVLKQEGDKEPVEVVQLKAGDFFGERALIRNEPRAATVKVISREMTCLYLDRESFSMLMGSLEDTLSRKINSVYDKPIDLIQKEMKEVEKKRGIKRSQLAIIGTLGKGAFGLVQLVFDKPSRRSYALKSIHKSTIVQYGHQVHVFAEKDIMISLDCDFIVRLLCTYSDENHLYFLMELALGGELFTLLRSRTAFDDSTAKFYAAIMVCVFEYMHSKDIIYRDLKPENILLDRNGYLKLTDFGFAKVITERTYTLCGTPDYLAPEVVSGIGHGKGVDWWTLGILTYEMLASYPPFYHNDPVHTYWKILNGRIMFPRSFTRNSKDIVKKFLNRKPSKRLGLVNSRAGRVKEQPWFSNFTWTDLYKRRMKAPIIPVVESFVDLSNFETDDSDPMYFPDYIDDGSGWDHGFATSE